MGESSQLEKSSQGEKPPVGFQIKTGSRKEHLNGTEKQQRPPSWVRKTSTK